MILRNLVRVNDALEAWDFHDADPTEVAAPLVPREALTELRAMLEEEWERLGGARRRAAAR